MKKILITGGSGFIGTNLVDKLLAQGKDILSVDIAEPKIKAHYKIWKKIDIRELELLQDTITSYQPDYVIHLAARTDLDGKTLKDYNSNTEGVRCLLEALDLVPSVKRAIFASSMYVCEPGYIPKDFDDFAPHTLYGQSKVETENIIKKHSPKYIWSIIRPTSIWGPWFGEPYNKFFHVVLNHMYFHMGKRACRKTYGYVDNAIYEIMSILEADEKMIDRKVFYVGDYEPYDITEWANEIAKEAGIWIPRIPYWCFVCAGWLGDLLKKIGVSFPMTSFRLHNMTTDNVHNLNPIREVAPNLPVDRSEGTRKTLEWINNVEKKM